MERKHWILLAILVGAGILLYFFYSPLQYGALSLISDVSDYMSAKTTVLSSGLVSIDGENPADPQDIASAAGIDVDTMSLGRVIQSEASVLPDSAKIAVAHAVMNYASAKGWTITDAVTKPNGYYGKDMAGRYCSTQNDPSTATIQIASDAINGVSDDPTGGARQWDSPWSYVDPTKADSIAASRKASGLTEFDLPDVPSRKIRFWV